VGAHEAQSYKDPGTPEEQSRRKFLANATLAIGGVIGLVVAVPTAASLIPESLLKPEKGGGVWTPLSAADMKALEASTDNPVKITFRFKYQDAYLPPMDDTQFVWGVKLTPEQAATFQAKRPDLFAKASGKVDYPAVTMNFVLFSSVCPHLGCRFNWDTGAKKFICPCHGSQFSVQGQHLAGPAPRGLDPLPFREKSGKAEVTWIQYKSQEPGRIIVAYS
jgi:Rieske Fe-S protein